MADIYSCGTRSTSGHLNETRLLVPVSSSNYKKLNYGPLHGNNDPTTTRPSNQSQTSGSHGDTVQKASAERLRNRPNSENEEIGQIDWTWCGLNTKLTHFILLHQSIVGGGGFQMSQLPGSSC